MIKAKFKYCWRKNLYFYIYYWN